MVVMFIFVEVIVLVISIILCNIIMKLLQKVLYKTIYGYTSKFRFLLSCTIVLILEITVGKMIIGKII